MTDDRDRSDTIIIQFAPTGRATRRQRFEPFDGEGGEWERIEEVINHRGEWHQIGRELVESIRVENWPPADGDADADG